MRDTHSREKGELTTMASSSLPNKDSSTDTNTEPPFESPIPPVPKPRTRSDKPQLDRPYILYMSELKGYLDQYMYLPKPHRSRNQTGNLCYEKTFSSRFCPTFSMIKGTYSHRHMPIHSRRCVLPICISNQWRAVVNVLVSCGTSCLWIENLLSVWQWSHSS
jgi:hypothetical protein